MKILILKPSSLGDVVHAIPVLRCLRRHFATAEIFWWVDAGFAPLLAGDPDLTGLVLFDRHRWAAPRNWPKVFRSVRQQRRQRFDWVIDLQSLARSGIFAWLANGKLTIGLDDAREGARGCYDIIVERPSPETHAVDWYLRVLPRLGVPVIRDFEWLPARPDVAAGLQAKWPLNGQRWIILNPGARWTNKRWPVEHFADVVRHCAANHPDLRFAVLGAGSDRALGQAIAQVNPERCVDVTGQTTLPEMVEWIRHSELVVSNDTGPMHVAAALGKPVLALFGPTNPRRTGPYGQQHEVLQHQLPCVPCMRDHCAHTPPLECLHAITPNTVARAIEVRLNANAASAKAG